MRPVGTKKDDAFLVLLCFSFIVGLAVALGICAVWRYHPELLQGAARNAAIAICPPFLLAGVLEATTDSTLALVMTIGCIVFGNGFLYAGLCSLAYWLLTSVVRRR